MSEYLRTELVRVASRPTPEELVARVRARDPVERDEPPAVSVRRLRGAGSERAGRSAALDFLF